MADPLKAPRAEVMAAIHQAVMQRNLRKIEADQLITQVTDHILGAGPLAPYFRDPTVTEIVVNGPQVYVERHGQLESMRSLGSAEAAIRLAQHLCRHEGLEYQSSQPLMNFIWAEDRSRINIVHHSRTATGVAISIRKRQQLRRLLLPDLIEMGSLTPAAADLIVHAVAGRLNVVLTGPQGSGKTELLRALALAVVSARERVITIEDAPELDLALPHVVALVGQIDRVTEADRDRGAVSQEDLFRNTLRMRPDRIIFGELRGPEALAFFEALMSSQGGSLTTMHLYTPELLPDRLYQIAAKHGVSMPYDLIQRMVYGTVALIVQLERDGQGHRHVQQIVEVGRDGAMHPLFRWESAQRQLVPVGALSADRQAWIAAHSGFSGESAVNGDA